MAGSGLALLVLYRPWRRDARILELLNRGNRVWPFPVLRNRGTVRATYPTVGGLFFGGLALMAHGFGALETGGRDVVRWGAVATYDLGCVAMGCLAAMITVALFNWPKFLAPPPMTADPGIVHASHTAMRDWLRRERRRPRE